jgi:exosortase/archaeosortase family protein
MLLSPKPTKHHLLNLYGLIAIFLSLMPVLVVANEALAKFLESTTLYLLIQRTIVPYEVKIVAAILYLLKVPTTYQLDGLNINGVFLQLTWNCLGWQSLLFLLVSFLIGLPGKYRKSSILEVIIIGLLGTFLINIARITMVTLLGAYLPAVFRVVFHDYLAAAITLVWLGFFWWFSFKYVLEEVHD